MKDKDHEGMEYDKDGKPMKGGGYMKKAGKLYKMKHGAMPYEKSDDLSGDDLQKSLNALEDMVNEGDSVSRKDQLLAMAHAGELEKSERDELFDILGGGAGDTTGAGDVGETLAKSLSENPTIDQALDVSDYLREQHGELVKSLYAVGEEIQKSESREHERFLVTAKAISDIGHLVKGMSERLGVIETQPAHAPKSLGIRQDRDVLNKGFGGTPPAEEQLTKSSVLNALDAMNEESFEKGMEGRIATGEDITLAVAHFEQTNGLNPRMHAAIIEHIQSKRAAH